MTSNPRGMLSEAELLAAIARVFPVVGERHSIELAGEHSAQWTDGGLVATLRLVIREADGSIRDLKEQSFALLPARHRDDRGVAYLEVAAERARGLAHEQLAVMMPMDLFAPELLDAPLGPDAFRRVLDDDRARTILERRPQDEALMATLDPATRPTVPVLRDRELEARILERIDDPAAYAVYGDWLSERGDPRGELVALQLALAAGYDQATAERAQRLLDEYAWDWLGKLAWLDGDELLLEWRHGFVKEVWFGDVEAASARGTDTHIEELARLPSMALVERIEIGPKEVWFDDAFRTIGRVGLPATTRALVIVNGEYEHLGRIEPAYPGLSHVEDLRLHSRSMDLGRIELPSLRALELVTRGLTRANLASLHAARWPHLEKLVLWIGDEDADGCDIAVDDLDWILAGEGLPAVTCLGLCGRVHVMPLLERLVVAPIVKRLAKLEHAGGYLGVAEVTYLREHHGAFAHLQELRVPGTVQGIDVSSIGPNVYSEHRFIPVYE